MLLFLIWGIAFASPVVAIVYAARSYAVHRRRRPERERRIPVVAYVLILLIGAAIAYMAGMIAGISWACSGPNAGNLCGLFGVFISGPLAASLGVILLGALLRLLPADVAESDVATAAPTAVAERWWVRLWRGEYPLATSFWFFLVLGTLVGTLIRVNPVFLFLQPVALLALLAYQVTAGVGVWRSGEKLIAGGAASAGDWSKVIAARFIAVVLFAIQAMILLRMLLIFRRV